MKLKQNARLVANITPNLFAAEMNANPPGNHVGWVALYKDTNKRDWFRNPSKQLRDYLWDTARYVWVRGLFFDGKKYYIGA